ncbi:MAG: dicarboxylate/amino acid:cation symporter [Corynebacterium sp.]|uniref:dicarboxylate/amino acid:cation symporter n=2 Tax=Corynebacterium sp. TaxID=1720 RepID=UPI0026472A58|nr:dicarboxylate/amino acid:cation symporter [Corynebacterium sp.]MDN5723152.1 dicarboxylate/amino acid:cation symporter [Corynebacterium sp.]MDN6283401.1 dicarboxylate/amino acid:cation symporter [Corynebacterium sp.]MDN6306389.1 dicarboxylate/amino acid:cation symporter [Corynebacterium sp.]MDN6352485.1 dicarboxylate/amino acid:cation symporter [Corynebacterium sp.]MDN6368673.1 dicarboxylate/amino acid:cation symporter [Corynebacterium sp.]
MTFKKLAGSLLFRIIVAIILGIACSFFFPDGLARVFVTFNGLFGNFLDLFIPVLIFALITPAIAGIGRSAGRWLGITAGIAYASTIISGLVAFGVATLTYGWLLGNDSYDTLVDIDEGALEPFFDIEMPAPFEIMTALILAFCIGLAMTAVKSDVLYTASRELESIVMKVVKTFIIPLLPIFIFGVFLSMGMNGHLVDVISAFIKVLLLATVMTILFILAQYLFAGAVTGRNPFKALWTMMPAYATALGTSSSAATIPVTLESAKKNGVPDNVAGFVVPLCATIHLAGSVMKISLFALAVIHIFDLDIGTMQFIGSLLLLGIMMIAAPGVPGGAIMAAAGVLGDQLGFTADHIAIMIAAYIAIDSFGTAANVTGDGAIAMIVAKISDGKLGSRDGEGEDADGANGTDPASVDSREAASSARIAEDITDSRN